MSEDEKQNTSSKLPVQRPTGGEINPLTQYGPDLPKDLQDQLKYDFLKGQMELSKKFQELNIDNQALAARLGQMSDQVKQATDVNASATITGAYNDKMGRTEVIMGNTETAAKGKLDRTQKGQPDYTIIYLVIGIIGVIILAAIILGR